VTKTPFCFDSHPVAFATPPYRPDNGFSLALLIHTSTYICQSLRDFKFPAIPNLEKVSLVRRSSALVTTWNTHMRCLEIGPGWPLLLQKCFDLFPRKILIRWKFVLDRPSAGLVWQCGPSSRPGYLCEVGVRRPSSWCHAWMEFLP